MKIKKTITLCFYSHFCLLSHLNSISPFSQFPNLPFWTPIVSPQVTPIRFKTLMTVPSELKKIRHVFNTLPFIIYYQTKIAFIIHPPNSPNPNNEFQSKNKNPNNELNSPLPSTCPPPPLTPRPHSRIPFLTQKKIIITQLHIHTLKKNNHESTLNRFIFLTSLLFQSFYFLITHIIIIHLSVSPPLITCNRRFLLLFSVHPSLHAISLTLTPSTL